MGNSVFADVVRTVPLDRPVAEHVEEISVAQRAWTGLQDHLGRVVISSVFQPPADQADVNDASD